MASGLNGRAQNAWRISVSPQAEAPSRVRMVHSWAEFQCPLILRRKTRAVGPAPALSAGHRTARLPVNNLEAGFMEVPSPALISNFREAACLKSSSAPPAVVVGPLAVGFTSHLLRRRRTLMPRLGALRPVPFRSRGFPIERRELAVRKFQTPGRVESAETRNSGAPAYLPAQTNQHDNESFPRRRPAARACVPFRR